MQKVRIKNQAKSKCTQIAQKIAHKLQSLTIINFLARVSSTHGRHCPNIKKSTTKCDDTIIMLFVKEKYGLI